MAKKLFTLKLDEITYKDLEDSKIKYGLSKSTILRSAFKMSIYSKGKK